MSKVESVTESQAHQGILNFDSASVVQGMVYHLLDEKLAKSVSPETIDLTIKRLASTGFTTSISRSLWSGMTNPQRLDWLQRESHTISLVGVGDVVSLHARRSK